MHITLSIDFPFFFVIVVSMNVFSGFKNNFFFLGHFTKYNHCRCGKSYQLVNEHARWSIRNRNETNCCQPKRITKKMETKWRRMFKICFLCVCVYVIIETNQIVRIVHLIEMTIGNHWQFFELKQIYKTKDIAYST